MRLAVTLALLMTSANLHAESLRILFVGNSLTYSNDMPAIVKALGKADGRMIDVSVAAYPNFSLEDHLADGRALKMLRKSKWDFVVMQQGPSAMPDSRELLIRDAVRMANAIRKSGATPVMLTVWPSMARAGDFDRVIESYRLAAEASGSLLVPAGESWKRTLERDPAAGLYRADGFHPSEAGSKLVAGVLYRALLAR
ncbi:MAG: SGNH/GDSL hydrolase family protein [Thermoanaerobaculia bacterium]|nr:SGNH/GDSL hydrolase family protein [Thermoanaerobaculia bacterium]